MMYFSKSILDKKNAIHFSVTSEKMHVNYDVIYNIFYINQPKKISYR